jgi:hypothetical protein
VTTVELADLAHDVEAALLARGAVRRGRHLRFSCPAPGHADAHPSCDVDLERGWYCRACHAGGGLRELAALLGITPAGDTLRQRRWRPPRIAPPPPGIAPEDWAPAWLDVLERARRQQRRLAPHREVFRISDWLRPRQQAVADARQLASVLGEAHPGAWRLLRLAARVATTTAAVEAELDQGRQHVA